MVLLLYLQNNGGCSKLWHQIRGMQYYYFRFKLIISDVQRLTHVIKDQTLAAALAMRRLSKYSYNSVNIQLLINNTIIVLLVNIVGDLLYYYCGLKLITYEVIGIFHVVIDETLIV